MYVRLSVLVIVLAMGAFGQASDTPFQVRYAANLNIGDSGVTLTNTGASMTSGTNGILCANVYVLDPAGAPISCSSYVISPNVTLELSVKKDLIRTAPALESVVIKVLGTLSPGPPAGSGLSCTGSASVVGNAQNPLATGLLAYGTTAHLKQTPAQPAQPATSGLGIIIKPPPPPTPPPPARFSTSTRFTPATLSAAELNRLTTQCAPI